MASRTSSSDEALNRLLLDIKALMLLSGTSGTLSPPIKEKILSTHDEQISAFISEIGSSAKKPSGGRSQFFIAVSEMILAAILTVVGLAILAPSVVGFSSQGQLLSYFEQITSAISVQSLSSPVIPVAEFVIAVLLLIGAFYNLRMAASNLRTLDLKSVEIGTGT